MVRLVRPCSSLNIVYFKKYALWTILYFVQSLPVFLLIRFSANLYNYLLFIYYDTLSPVQNLGFFHIRIAMDTVRKSKTETLRQGHT